MKKENIELDYDLTLDNKFIEKVGSPFEFDFPILGTGKSVKPIRDKKILVIRLAPCAELYARNNSVTYITDNKEKYDKFLEKVNDEKYGSDDNAILFNDWKNIDKLLKENDMKFDVCVMNPPYDRNLHLQILSKVIKHCDKTVNISPIRWLQDPFAQEKRSELKRFENSICKKLSSIEIVNCHEASDMFGINLYSDLGIYVSGHSFDYANFWKIGHGCNEISIINKVCNNATIDKLNKYIADNNMINGNYVLISGIAGGRGNKPIYKYNGIVHNGNVDNNIDFLLAWNTNPKHRVWQKQNYVCKSIKFNSLSEANNFYNSYNTKVLTYICKVSCQQQHIQLQKLPFMNDYSQPWTDKRLCEFFNITGYINDNTAEPGSEWETIIDCVKNN